MNLYETIQRVKKLINLLEDTSILDNQNFKNWFDGSKVVDKSGNPLIVYHGSPDIRDLMTDLVFKTAKQKFSNSTDIPGQYFFTDSISKARTYANPVRAFDYQNAEPGIVGVYLSIKNPLIINADGKNWRKFKVVIDGDDLTGTAEIVEYARSKGYDGVIVKNVIDYYSKYETRLNKPANVYVAFKQTQIKTPDSALFNPDDPNIKSE